jgi:hypothetical protein
MNLGGGISKHLATPNLGTFSVHNCETIFYAQAENNFCIIKMYD